MAQRWLLVAAVWLFGWSPLGAQQNLLLNSTFDTDLSSWTTGSNHPVRWQAVDADGSPKSGSMITKFPAQSGGANLLTQCVPVTAGAAYELSLKMRSTNPDPGVGEGAFGFFNSTDCSGTSNGGFFEAQAPAASQSFEVIGVTEVAPAGAQSVLVALDGSVGSDGGENVLEID